MRIIFHSSKMHKACSSDREMIKVYGPEIGKKLQQRLSELGAAPTMDQIPSYARCHPLTGDLKGYYAVDLAHPCRLIFKPCTDDQVLKSDGSLDISKVDTIEIIRVIDYH